MEQLTKRKKGVTYGQFKVINDTFFVLFEVSNVMGENYMIQIWFYTCKDCNNFSLHPRDCEIQSLWFVCILNVQVILSSHAYLKGLTDFSLFFSLVFGVCILKTWIFIAKYRYARFIFLPKVFHDLPFQGLTLAACSLSFSTVSHFPLLFFNFWAM